MRHVNIPIFIPHLGCPNMCVFCNQRSISGVKEFKAESVREIIDGHLRTARKDDEVEIAFFGGSFTGIDRAMMTDLLKIAYEYVEKGAVSSVRCSTRPDYIDEEVLALLGKYGVKVIELGIQSAC
jgi:histone acetyltransferase (RNA polymerase elongator complex component)